ncbi:hypothetical protein PTSG_00454 [Salpingoeca rosetta]|uniref:Uncharacterized protein n=1 Tax=Salpingoeca rosetta (strain ATCC 50818 / BSB-021) TaxID=946362 RepID=F2TWI9_SALR5|nr:uncharacterized protein PTSG_00454 [Salpingoeca rosetta]EGD72435.1 hypothetical protein PTSG_00454 [Salpingoeca rosetta]|eukprot:XP_004999004.1 hypothetical protein PTSG_00454 [Salpingoeca rosetta]
MLGCRAALEAAVQDALGLMQFEDACFLAERLVAEEPTDHSRFLLGKCYYGAGEKKHAISLTTPLPTASLEDTNTPTPLPVNRLCALATPSPSYTASPPSSRISYFRRNRRKEQDHGVSPDAPAFSPSYQEPPPRRSFRLRGSSDSKSPRKVTGMSRLMPRAARRSWRNRDSKKAETPSPATSPQAAASSSRSSKVLPHAPDSASTQENSAPSALLQASHEACMRLLALCGQVVRHLYLFECHDAINTLEELPRAHVTTAWAQAKLGQAYFELADYHAANLAFRHSRRLDMCRLQDMEIFSTVLWHLKDKTALSYLANELGEISIESPITCCAAGNNYSLHKEHDKAVVCFEKAIQIDPTFSYSYTLLGHETFQNEHYQRAEECYHSALAINPRHYNALFGLGVLKDKQHRFQESEHYLKMAVKINPNNPVLRCFLAKVVAAKGMYQQAFGHVQKAFETAPENPLVLFERARVMLCLGRLNRALEDAERLKAVAPKEPSLYFLLEKIYRKMGRFDKAALALSRATELDPKALSNMMEDSAYDPHGDPNPNTSGASADDSGDMFTPQRRRDSTD